jgi:phosphate acetyltransferase
LRVEMSIINILKEKAKKLSKSIIYPEGEDPRVVKAAVDSISQGIIKKAGLVGNSDKIKLIAKELNLDLKDNIEILDPLSAEKSDKIEEFAYIFYENRKHKGITIEEATETVKKNLYFACLCVKIGLYDGFVGGAVNTTGDTVRAALFTLGLKKGNRTLSSFFIIEVPNCDYGNKGLFLFADSGVVTDPTSAKLVDITKNTRDAYFSLFEEEPICALLSYSTKGSAEGDSVTKMREALTMIKEKYPEIKIDGELQADAAIIEDIAQTKAPGSEFAGKANILIFPDLASGNISYKLVQRLAKATAIGPIFAGLAYPGNDLSRGCNSDDIVGATAVTVLQTQN